MTGMYLYRSHNDRIVAITHDAHDEFDTSQFKASIVGGRAMAKPAAMSLLNRFGGTVISLQGHVDIQPKRL